MRELCFVISILVVTSLPASAGDSEDSNLWITGLKAPIDSAWIVQFPTGPSDFFSQSLDVVAGLGNSENLVDGLPVSGVAISVFDFSGGVTGFARVGVYQPSAIDPTLVTPDLGLPISEVFAPPPTGGFGDFQFFELPEGPIPPGSVRAITAVQLPPGDPATIAIGADSNFPAGGRGGFTTDGYTSPAFAASFADFGINAGQDNSSTTSCRRVDRLPHGRLRVAKNGGDAGAGDHLSVSDLVAGDTIQVSFFGAQPGDVLRFYLMDPVLCTPIAPIGPVLSTTADADGDGSFLRVNAVWPACASGITIGVAALWGNAGCAAFSAGVGFTNCITETSAVLPPGPTMRIDDGSIESGWIVQAPAGSSDYFNNDLGAPPGGITCLTGISVAVLDFGTATPFFADAGVSNPNLIVDPTGGTPDVLGPGRLGAVTPFTFPPGTFATTSAAYVTQTLHVDAALLDPANVHAWVHFTAGDPGLLGVGADSSSGGLGRSGFTTNSYVTPAIVLSFVNWGIRLQTE